LFTKFDALDDKAYDDLEKGGASWEEAERQAPVRAVADFEKVHLGSLYGKRYPPKGHIYLRGMGTFTFMWIKSTQFDISSPDMNKPETNCRELTARTAAVLDNENLQLLFVSTQRNNLELCIEYAVTR
jgi:hypothetical protein